MAARRDSVHPFARVRFPEHSAGFVRTAVIRFDREGRDVAAHYEVRGYSFTRILATLYVYPITPAEPDLRHEFDRRRRELEEVSPATFVAEREVRLGRSGLEGRYAAYVLRKRSILGEIREQSVLVIARWGSWWVKWRVIAPDTGEDSLPPAALQLMEELTPAGDGLTPNEDLDEAEEARLALLTSWRLSNGVFSVVLERRRPDVEGFRRFGRTGTRRPRSNRLEHRMIFTPARTGWSTG